MTYEELAAILDEALKDCQYDTSESTDKIALALDKAWNRGAYAMLNSSLLVFLKKSKEKEGESA